MRCPHCGAWLPRITQRTPWYARRRAVQIIGKHSGEPARRLAAELAQERWRELATLPDKHEDST